mgnify:FL=1
MGVKIAPLGGSTSPTPTSKDDQKGWHLHRLSFFLFTLICEIAIVILYSQFVNYSAIASGNESDLTDEDLRKFYPFFQDVNVMIFIGFGFLMTFLHKYGFSSVGYNFVLAAFSVQIAVLFSGFWERVYEDVYVHPGHGFDHPLEINIQGMIKSLFAAGAVLISMGACLGKTTPSQLMVMGLLELFFFAINETIVAYMLRAVDMGGSMVVHTFGAYFGLAVSRVVSQAKIETAANGVKTEDGHKEEKSNKTSDMTAMIGTLFLWMFWPSFNGALAAGDQQQRVAINTFLALSACCCAAFMADNLLRPHHKFDMVSIQNATLAGGVAVGSSADLVVEPWGALLIGAVAGVLSVVGYVHITPRLATGIGLHDTCGVHNLHGMPGILGGLGGAISAYLADTGRYISQEQIEGIFPARAACQLNASLPDVHLEPCGLTAGGQGAHQAAALGITVALSIVTGIITGLVVKMPCLLPPGHEWKDCCKCGNGLHRSLWFDDAHYWEVPDEESDADDDIETQRNNDAGADAKPSESSQDTDPEPAQKQVAHHDTAVSQFSDDDAGSGGDQSPPPERQGGVDQSESGAL